MIKERTPYHISKPQHGEVRTCKNCGSEIKFSQHTGHWRHTALEPGYFGSDGFFALCGKPEPTEPANSLDPRHFLVTLARDGKAIAGPVYVNAVNRRAAARIAYDDLPDVKDSDTMLVWTLIEFDQNEKPGEYAAGNVRFNVPTRPAGEVSESPPCPQLPTLQLDDNEFCQVLGGLYGEWDRLTNELSAGPSEDNPGWEEDGLIWAIRANQALLVKLVSMRPEFKYLVADAIKRLL